MSLDDLGAARQRTLRLVAPLTQSQVNYVASADRWSIGEVADHLLKAEGLYRREIERLIALCLAGQRPHIRHSLAELNVAPAFVPRAILPWLDGPLTLMNALVPAALLDVMTEFPVMPVRNPDVATPRPGRPVRELRADLVRSFGDTARIIQAHAHLPLEEMVSDHPMTGRSNVPRILRFVAMHERRHQYQIERVIADPGFPRPAPASPTRFTAA